jgi:hypothetical protein
LDVVDHLKENKSVLDAVIDVHDKWFNTVGVHPDAELALKTSALGFEEGFIESSLFSFGEFFKAWAGVEDVGNEGKVEFGVALADFAWSNEFAALNLVSFHEHSLCTVHGIGFLHWSKGAAFWGNLVENDGVGFRVGDIFAEVLDSP